MSLSEASEFASRLASALEAAERAEAQRLVREAYPVNRTTHGIPPWSQVS